MIAAAADMRAYGWEHLPGASVTLSGETNLDFEGLADGYDYRFLFRNVVPSADANMFARVGTGATPTWASGESDYGWITLRVAGISSSIDQDPADDHFEPIANTSHQLASTSLGHIDVEVIDPGRSDITIVRSDAEYYAATGKIARARCTAVYDSATAVTAMRFYLSTGSWASGTVDVYRRRVE